MIDDGSGEKFKKKKNLVNGLKNNKSGSDNIKIVHTNLKLRQYVGVVEYTTKYI